MLFSNSRTVLQPISTGILIPLYLYQRWLYPGLSAHGHSNGSGLVFVTGTPAMAHDDEHLAPCSLPSSLEMCSLPVFNLVCLIFIVSCMFPSQPSIKSPNKKPKASTLICAASFRLLSRGVRYCPESYIYCHLALIFFK